MVDYNLVSHRVSTYLKAWTQRRLRDEVVKAKSRQRSRTKGGKRQKIYSVIEGKQCTLLNNVLYRFVFKKKQTVTLISLCGNTNSWVGNYFLTFQ